MAGEVPAFTASLLLVNKACAAAANGTGCVFVRASALQKFTYGRSAHGYLTKLRDTMVCYPSSLCHSLRERALYSRLNYFVDKSLPIKCGESKWMQASAQVG